MKKRNSASFKKGVSRNRKGRTFVVIGNSAAGLSAVDAIRQAEGSAKIVVISKEPHRPYSRCLLSYYLAGEIGKERIWIRPENYYGAQKVEAYLGVSVTKVDSSKKSVTLNNGKKLTYDKLLVASGASAKSIKAKGADKKGVFVLRTLDDAEEMLSVMPQVERAIILGGGLIGMRVAYGLKRRGVKVHVIVKSSHIFSQMLDRESSDMVRQHMERNGIDISTGLEAVSIEGRGKVEGVVLDDGNRLECQLIVIGKGVGPNIDFIKGEVETNVGIVVDEHLNSTNPDIYAAGDVAETMDMFELKRTLNAIWPAAVRQGKIAASNMLGESALYAGSYGMNSVDFFDLPTISFGIIKPPDESYEELIQADFNHSIYRKVIVKDDRIFGGIFVNDVKVPGIILHLALQRVDVADIKSILADEYFDYGKVVQLVERQTENFIRPEYKDTVFTYGRSGVNICGGIGDV